MDTGVETVGAIIGCIKGSGIPGSENSVKERNRSISNQLV
jgi:hypothetical protein